MGEGELKMSNIWPNVFVKVYKRILNLKYTSSPRKLRGCLIRRHHSPLQVESLAAGVGLRHIYICELYPILVLFFLTYFILQTLVSSTLLQMTQSCFFFFLTNILFYICTASCFNPFCRWTFRCFCVLAIENSAAVNTGVHVCF